MYIVFVEKTKRDLLTHQSPLLQGVVDVALVRRCHVQLICSMCLKPDTPTASGSNIDGLVGDGRVPSGPSIYTQRCLMIIFFIFIFIFIGQPLQPAASIKQVYCSVYLVSDCCEWVRRVQLEKFDVAYVWAPHHPSKAHFLRFCDIKSKEKATLWLVVSTSQKEGLWFEFHYYVYI